MTAILARSAAAVPMPLPPRLASAVDDVVHPLTLPLGALRDRTGGNVQTLAATID